MAALFGHVWDGGDLGRNMRGGSGQLPEALGEALGDAIRLRCAVERVQVDGSGGRVRHPGAGGSGEGRARTAIVAAPGPLVPALLDDVPSDVASALALIRMGPMVVVSLLTDETEPMPWDGLYSVLTPDKRFNMIFNHADFAHGAGLQRTGSVLMVYGGGDRGRAYLDRTDDELRDDFLADLYTVFPQVRGRIQETMVKRWQYAGPFAGPGRWRAQAALERGIDDRIFFAGDWVSDFVSMETAALTAVDAASNVRRVLGEVEARV
jgi:oxygen-dependent protoporphyrinogen oxidase